MQVFGMSDVGQKRNLNEDNFSACVIDGGVVALVCDGMGGANAGEVASRVACKTFTANLVPKIRSIRNTTEDKVERNLKIERAIYEASDVTNSEIWQMSKENEALLGMGTTLSGCVIIDDLIWTFNAGDSRVYGVSKEGMTQLTVDHSFVQTLLDEGKITAEEAQNHPNRNVILRALGVKKDIDCDVNLSPSTHKYYLICSDGMSNYFDENKFVKIITSSGSLSEKAESLVRFANSQGGSDNITVVLIDTER